MLSWWQSGYSPWPLSLLSWQLQLPSLCHIFANSTSLPYFCKFCNLAWGSSKAIIRLSASWICFLDIFIFCSVANLFASLPFSLCLSAYAFFDCSTFSCCPQPLFLVLSKLCNHGYSLICHLNSTLRPLLILCCIILCSAASLELEWFLVPLLPPQLIICSSGTFFTGTRDLGSCALAINATGFGVCCWVFLLLSWLYLHLSAFWNFLLGHKLSLQFGELYGLGHHIGSILQLKEW